METSTHKHAGTDSPKVDIADIAGPKVYTDKQNRGSMIQRGLYTLAANVKFVVFTQKYNSVTGLIVTLTTKTANQQFLDSLVVSGFTVSGSGTDTGNYIAMGYE